MKESNKSSKISNDEWTEFRREHQALYDFYYGIDYSQRFNSNDETEQKVYQCSQSGKEESDQDKTSDCTRGNSNNSKTQKKNSVG